MQNKYGSAYTKNFQLNKYGTYVNNAEATENAEMKNIKKIRI